MDRQFAQRMTAINEALQKGFKLQEQHGRDNHDNPNLALRDAATAWVEASGYRRLLGDKYGERLVGIACSSQRSDKTGELTF